MSIEKFVRIWIISFVVFVWVGLTALILYDSLRDGPYIFADISECENLEQLGFKNAQITRYDSSECDPCIYDIEYREFYGAEYDSLLIDFEIFAYEFESEDDGYLYIDRLQDETGVAWTMDGTKIYAVYTNVPSYFVISSRLGRVFSVNLYDKYPHFFPGLKK